MPHITFVQADGHRREVPAERGCTVMQTAQQHMVEGLLGDCGGALSCATCHGYVEPPWRDRLPPPSPAEQDMITATMEPRPNSRLCCQIVVDESLDGLVIHLPESQV